MNIHKLIYHQNADERIHIITLKMNKIVQYEWK